jgi:hypothetical protein
MLLCPTERARTTEHAQELASLYAKFSCDGSCVIPPLDALLSQAVRADSLTGFYYQVDPDVGRGSKRSLVSAAAATVNHEGTWFHLHHLVSPLARRVSFVADLLMQLERHYPSNLCTASVRPSFLPSMMELGGCFDLSHAPPFFLTPPQKRFSPTELLPPRYSSASTHSLPR